MAKRKTVKQLPGEWGKRKIKVYRITVDEKLDNNTVRFLVCPLVQGIEKFVNKKIKQIVITDRARNWDEERGFIVKRDDFEELLPTLGLVPENVKDFVWENINEGQIYLLGEVTREMATKQDSDENNDKKVFTRFIVDQGKANFYRIDQEVKETIKRLYFSTLRGRRKHASGY